MNGLINVSLIQLELTCRHFFERILRLEYTFFCKQFHFLLQSRVVYCRMNFKPESYLAVAYLINFQLLASQQLLIFNKSMLPSCGVIRSRSYLFSPFLVDLLCSRKVLLNRKEIFDFYMISATWSVNFQMVLLFYMSLSSTCLLRIRQIRKLHAKV